jgi:hypothetical protein
MNDTPIRSVIQKSCFFVRMQFPAKRHDLAPHVNDCFDHIAELTTRQLNELGP